MLSAPRNIPKLRNCEAKVLYTASAQFPCGCAFMKADSGSNILSHYAAMCIMQYVLSHSVLYNKSYMNAWSFEKLLHSAYVL